MDPGPRLRRFTGPKAFNEKRHCSTGLASALWRRKSNVIRGLLLYAWGTRVAQESVPGSLSSTGGFRPQDPPVKVDGPQTAPLVGIPTTDLGLADPGTFAVAPEPYSTSDFKDTA